MNFFKKKSNARYFWKFLFMKIFKILVLINPFRGNHETQSPTN
jgi:hypothetical protein